MEGFEVMQEYEDNKEEWDRENDKRCAEEQAEWERENELFEKNAPARIAYIKKL
jgi:hypothetical protein